MRALAHILVAVLLAVTLVNCHNNVEDERLLQAEALLDCEHYTGDGNDNANLARSILQSIDTGVLSPSNRALYAVMDAMTQFKLYADSIDTVPVLAAAKWYEAHGPRNRLVQAYTFAGAAAEADNDPVAAIRYYTLASINADSTDLFMQGYINLRMGIVYMLGNVYDSLSIFHLRLAIKQLNQAGNRYYEYVALSYLGANYRNINSDTAIKYMQTSLDVIDRYGLPKIFKYAVGYDMMEYEVLYGDPLAGARLAHYLINLQDSSTNNINDCHYCAIIGYAKAGILDSARYYISSIPLPQSTVDSLYYNMAHATYASMVGDTLQAQLYKLRGDHRGAQFLLEKHKERLDTIAASVVAEHERQVIASHSRSNRWIAECIIVFLITIAIAGITSASRLRLQSSANTRKMKQEIIALERQRELREERAQLLKQVIATMWQSNDGTARRNTNVTRMQLGVKPAISAELWNRIHEHLTASYGDRYDDVVSALGGRDAKDAKFVALVCLGAPDAIVCACCSLTNLRTVSNKRYRITEKLYGEHETIDKWLEKAINGSQLSSTQMQK